MVIPTETEEETRGEIKGIAAKLKKEKSQINDLATRVEWTEKQEQTTPSLSERKTEQRKKPTNCCFKLY